MGKIETRELTVSEVYNIVAFYISEVKAQQDGKDSILNHFSNLLNWKLKRNIDILSPAAQSFEEYRTKIKDEFINKWSSDMYSHDEGNGRMVKEEYMDVYVTEQTEANEKIEEILQDKNEYAINVLDIESEIENIINELSDVDVRKIDLLMFMNSTN